MRKSLNLGIAEAANRAGISPAFLSAIELSKANTSVATLHRLAATYNSTVLEFFDLPTQSRHLLRPGQEESYGLAPEWISSCRSATRCSNRCCSGSSQGRDGSYSHVGEEFNYMLKGTLEIWLGELERHLLRPGDSFWFESNMGHRWFNPSDEDALLLWINTPLTF